MHTKVFEKASCYLLCGLTVFFLAHASFAQTTIPAGGNVAAAITAGNTDLVLLGDAVWSTQLNINAASLKVDGSDGAGGGYTVTVPSSLTIINTFSNANGSIYLNNINFTRSAAVPNAAQYLIGFANTGITTYLNLEGSSFTNFGVSNARGAAVLFAYADQTITIDGGTKGVTFAGNRAQNDAGGVLAVSYADVTFLGKVDFTNNVTGNYGGAVTVYDFANSLTFKGQTTFTGNHSSVFGGALDVWGNTNSRVVFDGETVFSGNYVNLTGAGAGIPAHVLGQHARGGAVNIGYVGVNSQASVTFNNAVTFSGNYVVSQEGDRNALGGAISAYGNGVSQRYEINLNGPAIFTGNYVYSTGGYGYGGAIYYDASSSSVLNISSGSSFTNNYAGTRGGAIYLQSGSINLNALSGDIVFQGNRQGASFTQVGGVYVPTIGSGVPNAIYLGSSGSLNFNAAAGHTIQFYDPIASAAASTITVTKTGAGEVAFYGDNANPNDYISDIRGNTVVQGGYFTLGDQVVYGNVGQGAFTVQSGGQVRGGNNATLRTTALSVQSGGALGGTGGVFNLSAGSVNMASGAYFKGTGEIRSAVNINLAGTVTADIASGGNLAITPVLAGTGGGLTKQGAGTLTLNAVNTYAGATTVNAGTLSAGAANAFAASSDVSVAAGASLNLNGYNQTARNLTGGGTINLGGNVLSVVSTAFTEFSGNITGSGRLVKLGDDQLTLSGASTYTGGTTVTAGTLIAGDVRALGTGTVQIDADASLLLDVNGTMNNTFTGQGTLGKYRTGTVTLTGTGSNVGALNVNEGTLYLSQAGAFTAGTFNNVSATVIGAQSTLVVTGDMAMATQAELTVTLSGSQPIITADQAYLAGTLNINGGAGRTAAAYVGGRFIIIRTANGIFDDFRTVNTGQMDSGADYLVYSAYIDGNDYVLDTGLAWFAGPERGHGTFTLTDAADTFDVNVVLTNQAVSALPWDGRTLTKEGAGTLVLSALNRYTGATNVNAGTLQMGIEGAINYSTAVNVARGAVINFNNYGQYFNNLSGAGTVNLGTGALTVNSVQNTEFSGNLTGTGMVTKSGGAALTLSGNNSAWGSRIYINSGKIVATNSNALGTGDIYNTSQLELLVASGTATFANKFAGVVTNTASLTKTGAGAAILSADNSVLGNATVSAGTLALNGQNLYAAGLATANGATLTFGSASTITISGAFTQNANAALNLAIGLNKPAASAIITANSVSLGGTLSIAGFDAGTRASAVLGQRHLIIQSTANISGDFASIDFGGATSNYDFLTLDGRVENGNRYTVGFGLSWYASPDTAHGTFTLSGAAEVFELDEMLEDRTDTITSGWDGKSLTKAGLGTLILSAYNAYTGKTSINAGTLQTGVMNAFAESTAVVVANNAVLNLDGHDQIAQNLSGSGSIILGAGTLTAQTGAAGSVYSGVISGNGGVTKTGAGDLALTGLNTYRGDTLISAGGLIANNGAAMGTGIVFNNSKLELRIASGTATFSNQFSGFGGALAKTGAGTALLSADNSALGAVTVSAGELALAAGRNASAAGFSTAAATLTLGGNSTLGVSGAFTQSGASTLNITIGDGKAADSAVITAGSVTLGGTLSIAGFGAGSTYSAVSGTRQLIIQSMTAISGDFAAVDFGGAASDYDFLTLDGRIENGNQYTVGFGLSWYAAANAAHGTFTLVEAAEVFKLDEILTDRTDGITSGWDGKSLTKAGAGTLILAAPNTYTGATAINAGTLQTGVVNAFARSGAVTVAAGAVLDLNGYNQTAQNLSGGGSIALGSAMLTAQSSVNTTFSGQIAGSGGLAKTGAGSLILTGINGYSGGTVINSGGLIATNGRSLGSGTVTNSGTLELSIANGAETFANHFSGNGALAKTGIGTVVIGAGGASGTVSVRAGTLNFGQSGAFSVTGNYTTNANAGTALNAGAALDISGAFTQQSGAGLTVSLDGGAGAVITAASATIGGTLSVSGINASAPAKASELENLRRVIISTANGLSGSFSSVNLGPSISGADYLVVTGVQTAASYSVGLGLAWQAGAVNGSGTFTLGQGDSFIVDVVLADQSRYPAGWDGKSLTKAGAGTLVLAAENTYTGATAINAGTLQTGVADAFARSSAVNVASGAVLDLNGYNQTAQNLGGAGSVKLGGGVLTADINTSATEFSGVISGAGDLIKTGAGALTLTGVNTYSGSTTIGAGLLRAVGGDALGRGGVINNSALELNIAAGTATLDNLFGGSGGTLSKTGAGTALLTADGSSLGAVTVSAGELALADGLTLSADSFATAANAVTTIGGDSALAINGALTQNAASALDLTIGLNKPANSAIITANSATLGGDLYIMGFGAGTRSSSILGQRHLIVQSVNNISGNFANIDFGGAASNYDFLLLDGRIENGNRYTVGFGLAWQAAVSVAHGDFTLSAAAEVFDLDTVLADRTGITSGWDGKSLTKLGAGTLILSGANTYTGGTNINAGTLQTGIANAFASSSAVTVAAGATLDLNGYNQTAQNLSGAGTVRLGTAALTVRNTAATVFSGQIGGSGSLAKTGAGRLTLTGANSYSGGTAINGGTLVAANGKALGSGAVVNNSTLELSIANDTETFGNLFSGSGGTLSKTGAGTALLTADGSSLGAVAVNAGELALADGLTLSVASLTTAANAVTTIGGDSTLNISGALTQNTAAALDLTIGLNKPANSAVITANSATLGGDLYIMGFGAGTRSSSILGQQHLIVQSVNNISGDFAHIDFGGAASNYDFLLLDGQIENGNQYTIGFGLAWQAEGNVAHGDFTLSEAAEVFDLDTVLTDRAGITSGWDGKSLTKQGAGTLILSGANTYSGGTNINAGTLQTGIADAFAYSNAVTVAAGATLDLNGYNQTAQNLSGAGMVRLGTAALTAQSNADTVFSGQIGGSGSLAKTGAGRLTLSGANTYSGGTAINAGTLIATSGKALGSGTVTNSSTLELSIASGTETFSNQFSGNGSLSKTGAGTAVIAGGGTAGAIRVTGGTLHFSVTGPFTANTYTTANGAATQLGPVSQLQVNGVFVQQSGSALSVAYAVDLPAITAASASLGGTLNVAGFSINNPVSASEVDNKSFVIIETTTGVITGDFDTVNFGSAVSPADYLILAGGKSADAKQYSVHMGLAWLAGDTLGNGVFTLTDANDYFNVDIMLGDRQAAATGWTGRDLTKQGAGTLVLSSANTYTGITAVNGGLLELAADGALGGTSELVIANGGAVDLGGTVQYVGKLNTAAGAALDFSGGSLTITDTQRQSRDINGGFISAGTLYGNGLLYIDPSVVAVSGANNDFTGNVIVADGSSLLLNDAAGVGISGDIELATADDTLLFTNVDGVTAAGTLSKTLSGVGTVQTVNGADISLAADNRAFSGIFDVEEGSVLRGSAAIHTGAGSILLEGRFVATADNRWSFINPVTGGGVFEKTGAGEMMVDQALNAFDGTIYIGQGRLLAGDINTIGALVNAQSVEIAADGSLSGSGTVAAPVVNHGTIAALNALDGHAADGASSLVIGQLTNNGVINLAGGHVGNTLTVTGGMRGGGTLVINTVVGDDASATDRLILDGGITSGTTSLKVANQGGAGAQTTVGILVVEAMNGAITNDNAFSLSYETTGYRSYRGTMVIGAYDYTLVKGGNGGLAESWYLVSVVDEGVPSARPESGVYLASREVSESMFRLGLHDRLAGYEVRTDPATGAKVSGVVWARAYASSLNTHADSNRLRTKTEMYVFQGGADVLGWSDRESGTFTTGIMFGIGNAKNKTRARDDGSYKADGRVDGYALGLYATWFENASRRDGFYADAWLQHAWFDNENNGHGIPKEDYDARLWAASLEGGYAFTFYKGPADYASVTPFVQVVYNHYAADTVHDVLGTRVKQSSGSSFTTRVGARLQAQFALSDELSLKPYLEAGWLHNTKRYAVNMNSDKVSAGGAKDMAELKLGLSGQLSENVSLSIGGWGRFGGRHEQYGGEAALRFEW